MIATIPLMVIPFILYNLAMLGLMVAAEFPRYSTM